MIFNSSFHFTKDSRFQAWNSRIGDCFPPFNHKSRKANRPLAISRVPMSRSYIEASKQWAKGEKAATATAIGRGFSPFSSPSTKHDSDDLTRRNQESGLQIPTFYSSSDFFSNWRTNNIQSNGELVMKIRGTSSHSKSKRFTYDYFSFSWDLKHVRVRRNEKWESREREKRLMRNAWIECRIQDEISVTMIRSSSTRSNVKE